MKDEYILMHRRIQQIKERSKFKMAMGFAFGAIVTLCLTEIL